MISFAYHGKDNFTAYTKGKSFPDYLWQKQVLASTVTDVIKYTDQDSTIQIHVSLSIRKHSTKLVFDTSDRHCTTALHIFVGSQKSAKSTTVMSEHVGNLCGMWQYHPWKIVLGGRKELWLNIVFLIPVPSSYVSEDLKSTQKSTLT